ncbi:MAG: alpha/beta fold hydrolase [Anaerolineae bacterium]|nr:alpha/beta fold hydrolase [Anaerolineae bacterium]
MDSQQTGIAQRSAEKLYFDHKDMDYYLSWIIGREIYDGADRDECMATAARIPNADVASWQREWRALAEQTEAEAAAALDRGELDAARKGYLRACTYYRAPIFIMRRQDAAFDENRRRMQACFHQAAALFDPPIEHFSATFEGHTLPGYAWKVSASSSKRPTLVVIGGIETFAEDCYFMIGSAAARHGYNAITVDLPGQGLTPDEGLTFGAKMEFPLAAALDAILRRPDVDPERVAVFGFSWGGHIVFKGAAYDKRIKAMIANPPMPNVFRAVLAQQQGHDRGDPLARTSFDQIVWRMGLKISFNPRDIARRLGKAYDYFFHGKADPRKIACPALLMAGEGEAPITLQIARECYAQMPNPHNKLRIFTQAEGGEAHCQINNLALPNGVMFNWLDEVFRS